MESIICKFVINLQNSGYVYTEKVLKKDGIYFNIYDGFEILTYRQETYHSIFGQEEKLAIIDFIKYAYNDIISSENFNNKMVPICHQLESVQEEIGRKNYKNPSLWNLKGTLLMAINNYNKLIASKEKQETKHDYEEDCKIINEYVKEANQYSYHNQKSKYNYNYIDLHLEDSYEQSNEYVRVKKSENHNTSNRQEIF